MPPDNNTTYNDATQSSHGLMSTADKTKLDGIADGAQVNQNAYATITTDTDTTSATSPSDTLTFQATGAATVKLRKGTVIIGATDTTYSDATQTTGGLMSADDKKKLDGVETGANKYVHPTSSGYKHIPSVGVVNQQLFNAGDGTARWAAQGISYTVNEEAGKGEISLMYEDEKTATAQIYTANSTIPGLMSASDKIKLDALPTDSEISATYAKKTDITGMYKYKGSVADASKLPTTGQTVGDAYNIETAGIYGGAGMNVAWNGTTWDPLGEIFTITAITNTELDTICV